MNYIDTSTLAYPLTQAQIRALHQGAIFPEPFEPPEGYAPVPWGTTPAHNPDTHRVEEIGPKEEGGQWIQQWRTIKLTAPEIAERLAAVKAQLLADATAKRWAVETGGVTFPDGTHVSSTTDDQNRITTVIANAALAGVTSVDFKAASGWVTLTMPELQGIAAAIAIHVQGCFSAERAHHDAITALTTLPAARAYDVGQGWPT